jgi:hypothetical protein
VALALACGSVVAMLREPLVGLYTSNPAVSAAALPLLAWVAVFHLADASQTYAGVVLRAWRIATITFVVNAAAMWGVGLFGGYALAFDLWPGGTPAALRGAPGFWAAGTAGLVLAAIALGAVAVGVVMRKDKYDALPAPAKANPPSTASRAMVTSNSISVKARSVELLIGATSFPKHPHQPRRRRRAMPRWRARARSAPSR